MAERNIEIFNSFVKEFLHKDSTYKQQIENFQAYLKKYNLEEVVEYAELKAQYEELEAKFSALETEHENLKAEIEPLKEFKLAAEKKDKQNMIDQFYMLSDDDKADVIANIDAKLSIICVRNKVSFDLDENNKNNGAPTVYNLNDNDDDANVPAWVKSLRETAKSM